MTCNYNPLPAIKGRHVSYTWLALSDFVKGTRGRDDSHGWHHMNEVAKLSLQLYANSPVRDQVSLLIPIMAVAWLHDYADHKYDKDGKLWNKLVDFVEAQYPPREAHKILLTIEMISYSYQKKNNPNFYRILGWEYSIVRDIVSDADKLTAIGKAGIERCIEYTSETIHKPKDDPETIAAVKQHMHDKLLTLKDSYIMTSMGKKLAEPLHQEMLDYLDQ